MRDTLLFVLAGVSAILIIAIQLILCFKAKKLLIKLLPAILSAAAAIVFCVLAFTVRDWSALVYIVFAFFAGVMLISSGIAWGIWAIIRLAKSKEIQQKSAG